MSSSPQIQTGAPLGVGAIISESFSILLGHFVSIVMLAAIPTLIGIALSGVLIGWGPTLGLSEPTFTSGADFIPFAFAIIAQLVTYGLTTALLVQAAYDAKLQRPLKLGRYVGPAMGAAVPIAVLGLAAGIMMVLGLIALIIPGLWIYAVFSVMAAAVVIEKVGFGGLGRSAALTKDYRWPIVGATILIGIINFVVNFVATYVAGMVIGAMAGGGSTIVVSVLIVTLISAIGIGLSSISIALIYARLREIKEGASVRDIAAVFD